MRLIACSLAVLLAITPALAGPRVIASIMPIHSIVSAVMGKTGTPELLLPGRLSEHTSSFTAAQLSALGQADLVFIAGKGLEFKLGQISGSEAVGGKNFIALSEAPGVKTHAIREGGSWETDSHESAEVASAAGVLTFDPHVWLDPENATAMATAVAGELAKADPANAGAYETNARNFATTIDATAAGIASSLAPVRNKPFIVFHDAYQYFEKYFGLNAVGSISDVSAASPSAQRLKEIRDRLAQTKAVCVFREPQFDTKFVDTVIEGSTARSGILDPVGAELAPGPAAYVELLRNLATNLKSCLNG